MGPMYVCIMCIACSCRPMCVCVRVCMSVCIVCICVYVCIYLYVLYVCMVTPMFHAHAVHLGGFL